MPQQLSHCRSSLRKVVAPSMQLHHCDSSCLAGSQHNLQQGLGAADGATQEQQPWAAMVVAAEVTGQKAFPEGVSAEMAAAQLVPRAEGQQTVTAKPPAQRA